MNFAQLLAYGPTIQTQVVGLNKCLENNNKIRDENDQEYCAAIKELGGLVTQLQLQEHFETNRYTVSRRLRGMVYRGLLEFVGHRNHAKLYKLSNLTESK